MRGRLLSLGALSLGLFLTGCGDDTADVGGTGADGGTTASPPPLFATDLQPVCSGATQSRAADHATATTHKILYFETYEEDLLDQSLRLPADWTVVFDQEGDAYAAVDLVACAVRTSEELAEVCEGYQDDETGAEVTVRWHTATYELTVRAARSGEVLGSTTLAAGDDTCPTLATWDEGETEVDVYASPADDEVTAFLDPFVMP